MAKLYESGHSLLAVSEELRVSRWKARSLLKEKKVQLRSQALDKDQSPKVAPYGQCLVNGKLVDDPKEQALIQLVQNYWSQGLSHRAIAKKLDGQKLKPRRAKTWSQALVSAIIKRSSKIKKM